MVLVEVDVARLDEDDVEVTVEEVDVELVDLDDVED
jgi:hypothetical protein